MAKWKVLNVVWGKYRIHHEEDGTWTILHGGCSLYRQISSLVEAKKKAEEYDKQHDQHNQTLNMELQRQAALS